MQRNSITSEIADRSQALDAVTYQLAVHVIRRRHVGPLLWNSDVLEVTHCSLVENGGVHAGGPCVYCGGSHPGPVCDQAAAFQIAGTIRRSF
jgi:hypothetical protein